MLIKVGERKKKEENKGRNNYRMGGKERGKKDKSKCAFTMA